MRFSENYPAIPTLVKRANQDSSYTAPPSPPPPSLVDLFLFSISQHTILLEYFRNAVSLTILRGTLSRICPSTFTNFVATEVSGSEHLTPHQDGYERNQKSMVERILRLPNLPRLIPRLQRRRTRRHPRNNLETRLHQSLGHRHRLVLSHLQISAGGYGI